MEFKLFIVLKIHSFFYKKTFAVYPSFGNPLGYPKVNLSFQRVLNNDEDYIFIHFRSMFKLGKTGKNLLKWQLKFNIYHDWNFYR